MALGKSSDIPGARFGILKNEGWDVSAVFQGSETWSELQRDERHLSAYSGGKWKHPFMFAKNNNGRATEQSKRILLMCNIGLRGLNNWTINTFVELFEFFGRWSACFKVILDVCCAGLPTGRIGFQDKGRRRFCEVRTYILKSDDTPDYRASMAQAQAFIEAMKEQIPAMVFLTWAELATGRRPDDGNVTIDAHTRPLETAEKLRFQSLIADVAAMAFPSIQGLWKVSFKTSFLEHPAS